ncbi:Increased rDNA silencing protein [Verticillium nonalfalfae]|uniref:Increased rDNA silencing protein n=1 Tax=Verticillium nonalfalfae TaxID=1051616 RepID=A0A3M9XV69_9PEZI|nr:Increased rDNA silencing protein [Verticillium nonalfalfae]RNJ52173.1 Increased rDNA silencing protein [Verticillium nonalfalfae]
MAHQPSARPAVPPPSQAASNAAAALQGANLAFARTTAPRPIPPAKRVPPNGALYAAATASTRDRSRSRSPAPSQSRQTTGGTDGTTEHARWPRLASSPPPAARLSPSSAAKPTSYDTKSPSYIAATLAASRSASPSPNANTPVPGLPAVARRRTSVNSLSGGSSLDLPDTSSIAPTTNLISMFERRDDNGGGDDDDDVEPTKKKTPVRRPTAMRRVPQLRAMTPEREISPQGRRTPPVRDSGSPATEETTPTARPKPRVKPKLRPMTPERQMSPDRREPGSPLRSEITPPSKPKPHVKARPPGPPETGARLRPPETQAEEEAAAKPRAPSPPKPMRAVMAPLRLTQRHAPETQSPQPQKGQPVPDDLLRPSAPETTTKTDRSNRQALAAKPKPPPSLPPTPSSLEPVVVPKTRKHRPESIEMPPPRIISRSETAVLSPVPTRPASQAKLRPPTPPQPRGASSTAKPAGPPPRATAPLPVNDANLAALSNGRRVSTTARPTTSGTSSSNETFVSASSTQTPRPASPVPRRELPPRPSSTTSMPVGSPTRPYTPSFPRRHPAAASTSSLPLHSLSNAIMAGSLAAARLTPSNTGASGHSPAPPLPRRHHAKSPRLRQTLRQPPAQSDDEETRRKKKHHGSHSNKKHFHHEGARRRWREEITPRERKRYEALWASNRGLLHDKMPPGPRAAAAADLVLNVVVREIWRRSRLPDDELGEVWDLVVGQSAGALPPGMLGKQEFVVGTWVVDQRLKGRKIPAKVGASVWDSAKGVRVWTPKAKEARRK